MNIAFIGGGNMATALISGLAKAGPISETVTIGDPNPEVRDRLESEFAIGTHATALDATRDADVIVLAIKPQIMPLVLEELADHLRPDQLVISVAAGTTIATLKKALGADIPIIRTMPNTPALLGFGITGLYAGPECNETQRLAAQTIMATGGATVWVDSESLIDSVTAISGSGPAYFYRMVEALRDAGEALGLPRDTAGKLAVHTAHGAGIMALESDVDVAELRRRVTSPGGTTQAALEYLENNGFAELIEGAATAAQRRGRELAKDGDN